MEKFEETDYCEEYQNQCLETESTILEKIVLHPTDPEAPLINVDPRFMHAAMGLVTEAAELMDAVKKFMFYGKKLDRTNLLEEAGDCAWYLSILLSALKSNYREVMKMNIRKLQEKRYKTGKFTTEEALNRDLTNERKVLEESEQAADRNDTALPSEES